MNLRQLPEDLDFVGCELWIRGQDRNVLELSLDDEHSVERIPMMQRQVGQVRTVVVADGQHFQTLLTNQLRE